MPRSLARAVPAARSSRGSDTLLLLTENFEGMHDGMLREGTNQRGGGAAGLHLGDFNTPPRQVEGTGDRPRRQLGKQDQLALGFGGRLGRAVGAPAFFRGLVLG